MKNNFIINKIDDFLRFSFGLGKVISSLFIVIFLSVFIYGSINLFTTVQNKTNVPKFQNVEASLNKNTGIEKVSQDKLTDKYGKEVDNVLSKYGLSKDNKSIIIGWLEEIEEKNQPIFINGLDKYLQDASNWLKTNGKEQDEEEYLANSANTYKNLFFENIEQQKNDYVDNTIRQVASWATIIVSIFLFILSLIIPILIKIEENTRKD